MLLFIYFILQCGYCLAVIGLSILICHRVPQSPTTSLLEWQTRSRETQVQIPLYHKGVLGDFGLICLPLLSLSHRCVVKIVEDLWRKTRTKLQVDRYSDVTENLTWAMQLSVQLTWNFNATLYPLSASLPMVRGDWYNIAQLVEVSKS